LTTGLPNHIKTILAWVVSIAITVVLLLALSPRTVAQAHETGSRAKTQNSHAKLKKHHTKHATGKKVKGRHRRLSPSEGQATAICADGSSPTSAGEGSFSCDDGSQPACENDAAPTLSSDDSRLVCGVLETNSAAGEALPACEDGSDPVLMGNGSFSCDVCDVNSPGEDED